jgi:tungstate transport system permease protein
LPLGSLVHFNRFRGKRTLINIIQTLYSVPTVCVGLFVFLPFPVQVARLFRAYVHP